VRRGPRRGEGVRLTFQGRTLLFSRLATQREARVWRGGASSRRIPPLARFRWHLMALRFPCCRVHYHRGPKKPARHRMLELLASSPEGCTGALLVRNGFSIDLLVDPIRAGLATATPEWRMGPREIEVARVRITEAGRRVLTEPGSCRIDPE
jgi:hypothetical protein